MKTLAPELSALMTILRSTGPVISTRLSWMSSGMGATCAVTTCLAVRLLGSLLWGSSLCNRLYCAEYDILVRTCLTGSVATTAQKHWDLWHHDKSPRTSVTMQTLPSAHWMLQGKPLCRY